MPARRRTTTQRGLGAQHQARRRAAIKALIPGAPCWRCGLPMFATKAEAARAGLPPKLWRLDLDHVHPRALGGSNGPAVLAHEHCDKAAGARLGNRLRAAKARLAKGAAPSYTRW